MRKIALLMCLLIIISNLYSCFYVVFASGDSGDLDDMGKQLSQAINNDINRVTTVDGKPINPGAYYVTTNSFEVKKDIDFSDLYTLVSNKTTGKNDKIAHEAKREILMAARVGFLEGYEDGTFKPDNPITRAEFIKMLMGLVTNRTFNFETVPTVYYNWAGKFVTLAEMQGIIEKDRYTEEELEEPITRLEVVCMLAKAQIKMKGIPQNQLGHLIYTDIDGLTEEEKSLLLHAASYDLLEGMKDGSMTEFEPTKNITRAETARALVRIY